MIFADVGVIEQFWRELLLNICQPIYKLIVYLYELFEVIGTAEILTGDVVTKLYTRVGMILGIYMLFRIIFSFIQMLINPDYISDKEKGVGKIASKAILTILFIAITPFLFNKAFEIQNFVVGAGNVENNVIAKLVFPEKVMSSKDFGPVLSAYLFESFYRYDEEYLSLEDSVNDCVPLQKSSDGVENNLHKSIVRSKGNIGYAKICLFAHDNYQATFTIKNEEKYKIDFTWNGVFAIIVGIVVCYTLLTYTIMVGVRVIQLAFLRIIAPMAILTYMSPKQDTMFSKWLKMCTTTYLDLFIRMAIIYFAVFIIEAIMSGGGIALNNSNFEHQWIVNVVMIVALLMFAKKAPELLKELIPSSGAASLGFGLKSPKKMFEDMAGSGMLKKVGKSFEKSVGRGAGLIDSLSHGDSLRTALRKNPGFFGSKKNELMKKYAPLAYKSYEDRITGGEEIGVMNKNWNAGEKLKYSVEQYMHNNGLSGKWTDIFDGETVDNYKTVYKNSEFIRSKMAVDRLGDQEKLLSSISSSIFSSGDLELQLAGLSSTTEKKLIHDALGDSVMHFDAATGNYNYVRGSIDLRTFHEEVAKHGKKVKGAEENHESLRKVHQKDAKVEDQIKYRKNNESNPTRP